MIIDCHSHLVDGGFFEAMNGKIPANMLDVNILLNHRKPVA
jgi:hypothetical protein